MGVRSVRSLWKVESVRRDSLREHASAVSDSPRPARDNRHRLGVFYPPDSGEKRCGRYLSELEARLRSS